MATSSLLLIAGGILVVLALQSVIAGVGLAGTPVWGYNDNSPGTYLLVGGLYVLVGALVFFAGILLAGRAFAGLFRVPKGSLPPGRELLFALGATLGILALAALGWGLAANVATPDETADPGAVGTTTVWTTIAAVLLGTASAAVFRALVRHRPKVEGGLRGLLAEMKPELLPGRYVFVNLPDDQAELPEVLASVQEPEGLSSVLRQEDADRLGLGYEFLAAWITLRVESSLDAVGLTAAVSSSLAENGISCNVIAGLHHDHLLVPAGQAERALEVLCGLPAMTARL
jgi:uncharacterized protein